MRLDYKKWKDTINFDFLDSRGYLTDDAKELMSEYDVVTLDELLDVLEGIGKGRWYTSDVNRSDVGTRGHYADTISGKFISEDNGRETTEDETGKPVIERESESNHAYIEMYDNMYFRNGKWIRGRELRK